MLYFRIGSIKKGSQLSLYSIEGSTIITLDETEVIVDGEIWIENDKFYFVDQKVFEYQGSKPVKKIDGRNRIAIPGLVNGHVHSYGALLKGSVDALPLDAFMINAIASAGKRSPRDAYISAILGQSRWYQLEQRLALIIVPTGLFIQQTR